MYVGGFELGGAVRRLAEPQAVGETDKDGPQALPHARTPLVQSKDALRRQKRSVQGRKSGALQFLVRFAQSAMGDFSMWSTTTTLVNTLLAFSSKPSCDLSA